MSKAITFHYTAEQPLPGWSVAPMTNQSQCQAERTMKYVVIATTQQWPLTRKISLTRTEARPVGVRL